MVFKSGLSLSPHTYNGIVFAMRYVNLLGFVKKQKVSANACVAWSKTLGHCNGARRGGCCVANIKGA